MMHLSFRVFRILILKGRTQKPGRKSTTGDALDYQDESIWWKAASQTEVATSTTEAEYISLFNLVREISLIRHLCCFIEGGETSVSCFCDNQSAAHLARHELMTNRTKHMAVRYHYIRQEWVRKQILMRFMGTDKQRADP